jgi:hypothetical protein
MSDIPNFDITPKFMINISGISKGVMTYETPASDAQLRQHVLDELSTLSPPSFQVAIQVKLLGRSGFAQSKMGKLFQKLSHQSDTSQ